MTTDVSWLAAYRNLDDAVTFRVGRRGTLLVAEWPGVCRLWADRRGGEPRYEAMPGADAAVLAKIQHGVGRALLRQRDGKLALHAAAVAVRGRALLVLGRTGAGKSTLGAALTAHGELLADDVALLEQQGEPYMVLPSEADHWLTADSLEALGLQGASGGAAKMPRPARAAKEPVPLGALVALVFDDGLGAPRIERLKGIDALATIVPAMARFVIDEPDHHIREMDAMSHLLATVPTFVFRRPRHLLSIRTHAEELATLVSSS